MLTQRIERKDTVVDGIKLMRFRSTPCVTSVFGKHFDRGLPIYAYTIECITDTVDDPNLSSAFVMKSLAFFFDSPFKSSSKYALQWLNNRIAQNHLRNVF